MPHALQFHTHGDAKEVLKYEEVEKPKIESPTQVQIRVAATPVNPSDLNIVSGTYGIKPASLPSSSGLEGVGTIEEIGSGVTGLKAGQRVHFLTLGGWRDYILVDFKSVVPIPDALSDLHGAQLTANPLTVVAMVKDLNVPSGSGEYLVQSAAGSALGRIMIQYAKVRTEGKNQPCNLFLCQQPFEVEGSEAKGFKTINIVRRDEQVEELKQLGADHVINSEKEDVAERIKTITNGEGIKYAIDCVGGKTGTAIIRALGKHGVCLVFGRLDKEPTQLSYGAMIFKEIVVRGFWISSWTKAHSDLVPPMYKELIELILKGQITLASKAFPASDFPAALEHTKTPGKNEKTILLFNQK
eukprot:Phypoly_transcript_12587.p1 GENE.Phypoly_transcript_12587~~Phypoly_transcript_12587.p1  ORF type:complete len:356 (-),score=66.88 Phypoly_transcript_12587:32-1099(-)